jgi:hypothetical protein
MVTKKVNGGSGKEKRPDKKQADTAEWIDALYSE